MTLYVGDKPFIYPQEDFERYYNENKEKLYDLSFRVKPGYERTAVIIALAYLDEHAALREYVRKDNPDFPYGK